MKIKSKHRDGTVSLRMDKITFNELMTHLNDCKGEVSVELIILADAIIDEENIE